MHDDIADLDWGFADNMIGESWRQRLSLSSRVENFKNGVPFDPLQLCSS